MKQISEPYGTSIRLEAMLPALADRNPLRPLQKTDSEAQTLNPVITQEGL
jgi:hypothetical protein